MGDTHNPTEEVATMPTTTNIDAWLRKAQAEFDATKAAVPSMRSGQVYRTGFGGELTVNLVHFVEGTTTDEVLERRATAEYAVLTQDGRQAITNEWHDGAATSDEWVYVERWSADGRVFHGYVDPTSRKLLQTG
jgi:hypothetical protein